MSRKIEPLTMADVQREIEQILDKDARSGIDLHWKRWNLLSRMKGLLRKVKQAAKREENTK